MPGRFEGKIALVTGAARGIGRATAVRLARDGAAVVVNYKANAEAAKEAAGLVTEAGGRTKTVAREMASRNITANAVAPGLVPTELTAPLPQAVKDAMLAQTPLARFGTVEDVANAVAFLASDDAAYVTGQVIVVDGGMVTA